LLWSDRYTWRSGRVVRDEDQKDFRDADANAETQASEKLHPKINGHSVAHGIAETQEGFADSVAKHYTEDKIKTQKRLSYANRDSRRNSSSQLN
jgi:hypothetical protein